MTFGDRRTTAYHEAAHSVVALRFGSTVRGIVLDGAELEPRNLVAVSINEPTGKPIIDIAVACAGYRAQLRLEPDDTDSAMRAFGLMEDERGTHCGWDTDYEHALFAAARGYPRWWRAARAKEAAGGMSRATRDHVLATRPIDFDLLWGVSADIGLLLEKAEVWADVEAVAEALMARGRLGERDLAALVA